jgi:oxygen-independent coproporphyrinogen-3 oxidase
MSKLGVYFHIPYCLQRCTYCDFATYVHSEIRPPREYAEIVKKEIQLKKNIFKPQTLNTIYFGGGTPSLIDAHLIVDLISELAKFGYTTGPNTEITIEINPATVDEQKLETYLKHGINRFSVGAQTFSDRLLKMVNREHNAQQTVETLTLLKKYDLNFSFDLLFALPTQSKDELIYDLDQALQFGAKHISPYCLTVPEGHPLSKNRPLEDDQIEMFDLIHNALLSAGHHRYEISNYAIPGFESQHNLLYWSDENYWGLGLSAHSYKKNIQKTSWGQRFWNLNPFELYCKQIENSMNIHQFSETQSENLEQHQALTDYCHTSLRLSSGLSLKKIKNKFNAEISNKVLNIGHSLLKHEVLSYENEHFCLTQKGILVSNQIFEKFTFLKEDLN